MTLDIQPRPSLLGLFPDKLTFRLHDPSVEVLRVRHYSRRTEEADAHWIRRNIKFHQHRYPRELAEGDAVRQAEAEAAQIEELMRREEVRRKEVYERQKRAEQMRELLEQERLQLALERREVKVAEGQPCPRGHSARRDWKGTPRCWACGWPEK